MSARWDAIVVGGGHNGLVCAATLGRAGRKVLVLERRHVLGGAAVTEELHPGFKFTVCSYVVSLLRPAIWRELELAKHGLELIPLECSFTPHADGPGLCRWPDPAQTHAEISRFSPRDADRYPSWGRAMGQLARFARDLLDAPAPDPFDPRWADLGLVRRLVGSFRELGDDLGALQMRLATMSAADLLDEVFEADALKAPMSCSGIIGTMLGVRSPGSAYVLLHHYLGEIDGASRAWGFARGGNGAVSEAIARSARAAGVEIHTEAAVRSIDVVGGVTRGVTLVDGRTFEAPVVVSGCEPRLTLLGMVGAQHLPPEMVRDLGRTRLRGSSAKVNLALDGFPSFAHRPGIGPHVRGDVAIAPSVRYLEDAWEEAKEGRFSRRPYLNVVFPSVLDPAMAPPGKHVLSAFVQYAPYHLAEGPADWDRQRDALGDTVIDTLATYMPDLKERILYRQVLTPLDLEREFGLTEGHIFHGELTPEQLLFQRPVPRWGRWRTPVRGLWMCASGTHPGGGVMGAPGRLAAREMLRARAL